MAVDNGFGITGIVNNASATVVEPYVNGEYRVDLAIDIASSNASVGDIILIEQQGVGPPPDYPYVPVEYDPAIFARIEAAVSDGRVVVEPAGNGGADLDDPIFNGYFDRNNQDSGAILVAGGTSDDHSRWVDEEGGWASCYGSRIDVQGWADYSIVTLGYGDRYDGGLHKEYTATFGGTSGASAMVSGTATAPQGFYKATHGKILTPSRIREVLVDTGTPQGGDPSEHIGPLPDLDAALHELYTVYIGSTSYPTIQDALADAQSGDFVNVQKEVYIITDNIVVPSGVTLDIAPGCTLKFIPGSNLQLVANGTLDAQGTASEKIIFSSAALNPSRGDWYGIKFNDSSDDSKCKIEYCNIYYAKFGIYCYKASPTIKNNLFKYVNPYGAYLYRSGPKLEGNTFEDNNFGVYAYLSSPNFDYTTLHINNNDFISNDSYGLFLSNSSPTIANDNLIDGNGGVGVYCYNFSNPIIGKNTITDNTYDGICCSYTSYPNIFYNSYYDLGGCNTITGNHRHGVYAVGSSYPALGYYPTSPGNNNLHDNSGYEVYNGNSSGTILAESNYWGTEFYAPGDSVYGSVDDDPFLTGPAECTQELAGGEGLPLGSPDTPQYHNQLGARLLAEGRYKEASEAFQFVIDSYAETEEAKYAVAHIAICFQSMRKADLVVPYLEEVADRNFSLDLGRFALALSIPFLERAEEYRKAIDRIDMLMEDCKDEKTSKNLLFQKANIYLYGLEDEAQAITNFQDFLSTYPEDDLAVIARAELELSGVSPLPKLTQLHVKESRVPEVFSLFQNYPNPFNPSTDIGFQIPDVESPVHTTLKIYNILGQEVRTLVDEVKEPGYYTVTWDGRDERGDEVSSGMYFCRLTAATFTDTKRMVLMK